jgi:MarR family transcriptional regulator, organic hydroperoxide resistance regulator
MDDYKELASELFEFIAKTHKPPFEEPTTFSRGEMGILIYLNFKTEGVTSGELSEYLSVSTGRVATALKSLEKKGLIVRSTDISDKRRVIVFITDAGRKTLMERHQEAIEKTAEMLQKLNIEDAKEFIRLVKIIIS